MSNEERMAKAFGVILWCETCDAECTGFGPRLNNEISSDYVFAYHCVKDNYFYVSRRKECRPGDSHWAGLRYKE